MPRVRRRRRTPTRIGGRRSSVTTGRVILLGLLAALLVLFALGVAQKVDQASGPYRRAVDRSYAALVAPLASRSNQLAGSLRSILADGPAWSRPTLLSALDALGAGASDNAKSLEGLTPPDPADGAGDLCYSALEERAQGSVTLGNAIKGLFETGSIGSATVRAGATSELERAGQQLERSDGSWSSCRTTLRRGPGSAVIPRSIWVNDPSVWSPSSLASLVTAFSSSPSLAAVHDLTIPANAISTVPAAINVSNGSGVIPPTNTLSVRLVVANRGSVDEKDATVLVTATPGGTPTSPRTQLRPSSTQRESVDVPAGQTVLAQPPALAVVPGFLYTIGVSVSSSNVAGSSTNIPVVIAQLASSVSVTSSSNPSESGSKVTYTAVVTVGGSNLAPSGSVSFDDAGQPVAGCTSMRLTQTSVNCSVSYPAAGYHDITATYSGDDSIAGSTSALLVQTVNPKPARRTGRG